MNNTLPDDNVDKLLALLQLLRDPENGCPWDAKQDFSSIAPYTIEEAYEVSDAIARKDWDGLKVELGDLLLQVVYHAQMAAEQQLFSFDDVAGAISDKLVRRHPHVFGDGSVANAKEQSAGWEKIKTDERVKDKAGGSLLGDIPLAMPALMRAEKMQKRAARAGFDWPNIDGVLEKMQEELGELRHEMEQGTQSAISEEFGDLLFTCANLARHLEVDPEAALRFANRKFEARFHCMEDEVKTKGRQLQELDLEELDSLWEKAKASISERDREG